MAIQFGLKLWSINQSLLEEAVHLIEAREFSYIELMKVPGTDIQPFLDTDVPYIIHAVEVDIANPAHKKKSREIIKSSQILADQVNAPWIIMHPLRGDVQKIAQFIYELQDPRILIENMPYFGLDLIPLAGSTPKEIDYFCHESKCGFCLDLNHAVKAACAFEIPYKEYITEFSLLNPTMYHLSDGTIDGGKDVHLSIGDGEYDMEFMMEIIRKQNTDAYVTLEVPKNYGDLREAKESKRKLASLKRISHNLSLPP